MSQTNKQQSIRNIIIFTILVNGLAWLGPLLGGVLFVRRQKRVGMETAVSISPSIGVNTTATT